MNDEDLFHLALEKPAGERSALLDQACAGDIDLRRRVDILLRSHESPDSFLVGPAVDPGALPGLHQGVTVDVAPGRPDGEITDRRSTEEGPGSQIGPYKLLQQIGEGGMGTVFMAEQTQPVRRKVALKVIKPGMDSRQVVTRFEAERQALALMDHVNIARVLDAGTTDSGRPYFVMELVHGIPITKYCDDNHLNPRQRLELFVPVCQAIQHAHQKGVIHRDVKPSNVLVTLYDGRPVPKVIDFGVAKAIDQKLTEQTMFTEFGAIIGTLEYMSPEQAETGPLDIDTRSDIYSLGVLLYELLTGSTPLEAAKLRRAAFMEILRRILEEEPAKPSTRLSDSREALASISAQRNMEPARLTRLVRGELDWIVMKSLEKDRTRRYETAAGFARDIQRYLDGDAVEACPPSASYKLKKFARKHRAALATAGAFALLLVAATAVSVGLALRADRERDRATGAERSARGQQARAQDRERMAIDAVKRFRDAVADEPELKNTPALDGLRKRLLKEPLAFFRALRDRLQADRDTRPESLAKLAQANSDLGRLTDEIGDRQDALLAHREALAIRQRLADDSPADADIQTGLARSYNHIGVLLMVTGKPAEALRALESALAILQKLADANPAATEVHADLARSHTGIGLLLADTGRPAEALKAHMAAMAIRRKLADADPTVDTFQADVAGSHFNIGGQLGATGKSGAAMKAYEAALVIFQKLADANPSVTAFQRNLALSHFNRGSLLRETGRPDEALKAWGAAVAIQRALADAHPTVTAFQRDLANCHHNIGVLQSVSGGPADALKALEAVLAIRRKLADANPTVILFQEELARSYNSIGGQLGAAGRPDEAMKSHEAGLVIVQKLAREHPESPAFAGFLGSILTNMAQIDMGAGRFEAARARIQKAHEWGRKALDSNPANPKYRETFERVLRYQIAAAQRLNDAKGASGAEQELASLQDSDLTKRAIDARLNAVLKGQSPDNDDERIRLALRAHQRLLYASAARLFDEALSNSPRLGDDRRDQQRYSAACDAALACSGRGRDDPRPDGAARAKLRAQALGWLKAELATWVRIGDKATPNQKGVITRTLRQWKADIDLVSIRDQTSLVKLPGEERAAFEQLWKDVDALLTKTDAVK